MAETEDAEIIAACRGAPTWITPEAVRDTLRAFGPLYDGRLTVMEAMEILINVGNLFDVLELDRKK